MPNSRKINQLPEADRPREKLQRKGVKALSDFELLEVIIGSGNKQSDVSQIARQTLKLLRGGPSSITLEALTNLKGISLAQATKIIASFEIAKRNLVPDVEPLLTEQDVLARIADIRIKQQEHLVCLSLDGGQRLIARRIVSIGTIDTVPAHPREIFADPIADRAASIVVAHNHPSGSPRPSKKDVLLTHQLASAGQLLGIPLRDHIIVTRSAHFSYRQQHLL